MVAPCRPALRSRSRGRSTEPPPPPATFRFVAAVFDSVGESAGKKFSLAIEPEISPIILTDLLPEGEVGEDYAVVLEATGTIATLRVDRGLGRPAPGFTLLGYGVIGGAPYHTRTFPIRCTGQRWPDTVRDQPQ